MFVDKKYGRARLRANEQTAGMLKLSALDINRIFNGGLSYA
jgi:hypothetical protein